MTKRITLEEAKQNFLPKPQTLPLNKDIFFTLIPDSEDKTMECVHYWVGKQYFNAKLSFNEGYIYILENKGIPGILKIGFTEKAPTERVKEINSGTGVITKWYIANTFACKSPKNIEILVHQQLKQYNVNKEGFGVTLPHAENVIKQIIIDSNASLSIDNSSN